MKTRTAKETIARLETAAGRGQDKRKLMIRPVKEAIELLRFLRDFQRAGKSPSPTEDVLEALGLRPHEYNLLRRLELTINNHTRSLPALLKKLEKLDKELTRSG